MRMIFLFLLIFSLGLYSTFAQETKKEHSVATSPRSITRKVVPPSEPTQGIVQPSALPPRAERKTATQPAVSPVREKTQVEKDAVLKKTVEFQKQRAAAGYASAQYDLGVRYLNGDGVEKNLDEGRKWLEEAAKQGNSLATKKLESLGKQP